MYALILQNIMLCGPLLKIKRQQVRIDDGEILYLKIINQVFWSEPKQTSIDHFPPAFH